MENLPQIFLREHRFPSFFSFKRVTKEGSGPSIPPNTLVKYTQEVFRGHDFTKVDLQPNQLFRVLSVHAQDPENNLPSLQQILFSMRLGEEAWTVIPSGYHQENQEAWNDLFYLLRITELESFQSVVPINQKYLSESMIGPNANILKRVLCEGKGECPPINYLVTYYYTAYKQDGTEFEAYTSKSHILPRIPLQDTHSAVYYALLTMKEGEDCVVFAPPEYFKFKYRGSLWFSIQLLYINEPSNCCYPQKLEFIEETELGEGVVKRKIVEGNGEVIRNVNKIWIEVEGWLEDSFQFQKYKEECVNFVKENKLFATCQRLLFQTMKKGEISLVKCPPGTHLYTDSLENETLWLKYTLKEYLEFLEEPNKVKEIQPKFQLCKEIKEVANRIFRSGIRSESKALYNKVNSALILKLGVVESLDADLKTEYYTLRSSVLGNLAFVFLKDAEEYMDKEKEQAEKYLKKVIEFTTSDLEINAKNAKALFRRSKAYFYKDENEKAREDLMEVLKIEPRNKESVQLLGEVKEKLRIEEKKQKNIFREVFKEENWKRESEKDEERKKKISENYEFLDELEEEEEINKILYKLNTTGITSTHTDAINLLTDEQENDENF